MVYIPLAMARQVREYQHTPLHHHIRKSEDIICRGGGNLLCRVFSKAGDGDLADTEVEVSLDGVRPCVEAGQNDDDSDNIFLVNVGRFPEIERDVLATHKLCTED